MERRIVLSLSELEIQGNSNGTIHIKWSPKEAGCWRDVLQLTDNRRIKYDIIISTTAKDDKKSNKMKKRLKPSLSSNSNFSTSTVNRQLYQNNTTKDPAINVVNDFDTQVKQCKSLFKYESDLDKENILNKNNEAKTCTLQVKDDRVTGAYHNKHDKLESILCEQNTNVWNDGSVLSQDLPPSSGPQDIRRVTYIKEKKPCSSILYEQNEDVENMECNKDKTQSDFSILLNKFTFTSTDVISSSPKSVRRESIESANLQIVDKHTTFNISPGQFLETSTICDMKTVVNAAPVLQPTSLHLSPIKSDRCPLINDIKNLISSSPIHFQHHIPKDPNEYTTHFAVDINPSIQTTDCEYFSFEVIPSNVEAAKKMGDVYIEISPPRKHLHSKIVSMSLSKLTNARTSRVTKSNTLYDGGNRKTLQLNVSATSELCLKRNKIFNNINSNLCFL